MEREDLKKKVDLAFLSAFYGGMAAHETLTRAAAKLTEMEAALGVAGRFRRMESGLEDALSLLRNRDYIRAENVLTELLNEETEDPHGI